MKPHWIAVTRNSAHKVEMAAPTAPNRGMRKRFPEKLAKAPEMTEKLKIRSFPIGISIWIPRTLLMPIKMKIGLNIWNTRAEAENCSPRKRGMKVPPIA